MVAVLLSHHERLSAGVWVQSSGCWGLDAEVWGAGLRYIRFGAMHKHITVHIFRYSSCQLLMIKG